MFTIPSGFIGNFKLGDNINHNLEILALLYRYFGAAKPSEKRLLCKPITLLLISIAEAALYDLHYRVRRNTWEGVTNLGAEAIAYIRNRNINKFAKYIDSAKRHDFFDAADTGYYENLHELNKLRNRFHIQNEKNDFEPDEHAAFNEKRKLLTEKALEKLMKTMARKFMRPEHTHYVADFKLPWDEHFSSHDA